MFAANPLGLARAVLEGWTGIGVAGPEVRVGRPRRPGVCRGGESDGGAGGSSCSGGGGTLTLGNGFPAWCIPGTVRGRYRCVQGCWLCRAPGGHGHSKVPLADSLPALVLAPLLAALWP